MCFAYVEKRWMCRRGEISLRATAEIYRLQMMLTTPNMMSRMPMAMFVVNASWKIVTPTTTAVIGSNEPMMAVGVEPISSIERVIVTSEIMVGTMASIMA